MDKFGNANDTGKRANADISNDRPAKQLKMDEAEKKKFEEVSTRVAKVEDYRQPKGVAAIKAEYVIPFACAKLSLHVLLRTI